MLTTAVRCLLDLPRGVRITMAVLVTAAIAVLCLLPGRGIPAVTLPFLDKVIHFLMFFAFGASWQMVATGRNLSRSILLAGGAYGLLLEVLQGTLALGRSFEWWDVLSNVTGTAVGAFVLRGESDV